MTNRKELSIIGPSRPDGLAMQVLFVSPLSEFSSTVVEVLRQIDPSCNITHAAQLSKEAVEHLGDSALALIDLDAFPANGEALIRQMTVDDRIPVVVVSESLDRKWIDRALDAGAVAYLPKTYAASLVEAVLQLVIGGERYRPYPKQASGHATQASAVDRQVLARNRYMAAMRLPA